ncbi:bifunctional riboflavin kinase/FAD synthetase [Lentisalinibacter sediminis]|uniref:bifunctional riboflavin kinase/FAD synthetase n=1 Tax=Lentisalinibacter sediminis TaxID=2992237 RepID=UPI00386DEA72
MKLSRTRDSLPRLAGPAGSVLTIGAYDGLHLGHRRILDRVLEEARALGANPVVMSFEPTPKEFFSEERPPARLMRFREKFRAFRDYGIRGFFCPRFDHRMADIGVKEFVDALLVEGLRVRHLVVGDDFRFARHRSGGVEDLIRAGERAGFNVEQMPSVVVDGIRVSSSAVREALAAGDMEQARRFLGRYYRMCGRVIRGQRLGRSLGYPTANVNLCRRQSPVMGIFAVRVAGIGDTLRDGVASVGTRPTVNGTKPLLEVHLFDFDDEIYGRYISVEFIAKLRDEARFADLGALTEQMHVDAAQAREILAA